MSTESVYFCFGLIAGVIAASVIWDLRYTRLRKEIDDTIDKLEKALKIGSPSTREGGKGE